MSFLFIILISFLCPFVSAQISDDYAQEAFSNYIDVLINFMVPLIIFVIVDYEFDDGSRILVYLARSLVFFVNVAIQQELAFIFSPFKVSNYIKILQHIVVILLGIRIIGIFYIFFSIEEETEEVKFEKKFIRQIRAFKQALEGIVKTQDEQIQILEQILEGRIKTQMQDLKKSFEESVQKQIQILKKSFEESVQKQIQNIKKSFEENIQTFKQSFEENIQTFKQFFGESIKTQIQIFEENVNKNFLLKKVYEPKFQILEERVKILEQLMKHHPEITILDSLRTVTKYTEYTESSHFDSKTFETVIKSTSNDLALEEFIEFFFKKNKLTYEKQKIKFNKILIQTLFLTNYTALTIYVIILVFLLNDLKENITQSFVMSLVITISLTSIIQFAILIIAYRRKNLKVYIKESQRIFSDIMPKYHPYINIIEDFITVNVFYLPSLINYFLLQTPNIFNKIFLNLSALLVTVWIIIIYKLISKNEEMNDKVEKEKEDEEKEKEDEEKGKEDEEKEKEDEEKGKEDEEKEKEDEEKEKEDEEKEKKDEKEKEKKDEEKKEKKDEEEKEDEKEKEKEEGREGN